MKPIIE